MNTIIYANQKRRSVRDLNKNLPISQDRLEEIVKSVTLQYPSAFDTQSARVVLVVGEKHDLLWDKIIEILRGVVQGDFSATFARLSAFKKGYGTILFFEDFKPLEKSYENFSFLGLETFKNFSEQSSGIIQYALWLALAYEGVGCNLQHYNPLIDEEVKKMFEIPSDWSLKAQLIIGGINKEPEAKNLKDINTLVKIIK